MKTFLFSIASLVALGLAGCGSNSGDAAAGEDKFSALKNHPRHLPPAFLDRIPDAPMNVAYGGKRHVHMVYTFNGSARTLDYDEMVYSDGQGHFAIDPGAVHAPPMGVEEAQVFALLQKSHEAFFYRYRDFRIRHLALFQQNYRLTETGQQITLAGRSCSELAIERRTGARSHFLADIDPLTGLVMRCRQLDEHDQVMASAEFTDFTLTPDLAGVSWHPALGFAPLDLSADTVAQVGFHVFSPAILPPGFVRVNSESYDDGEQIWAILSYSDGVEQVFFLHGSPRTLTPHAPTIQAGLPAGANVIQVCNTGNVTAARLKYGAHILVAVGAIDERSLTDMLKSSLH